MSVQIPQATPSSCQCLELRAVLPRFALSPDTISPGWGLAPYLTLSADPSLSDATVPPSFPGTSSQMPQGCLGNAEGL